MLRRNKDKSFNATTEEKKHWPIELEHSSLHILSNKFIDFVANGFVNNLSTCFMCYSEWLLITEEKWGNITGKLFTDAGSAIEFISQQIINIYNLQNPIEKNFGLFLFTIQHLLRLEGLRETTNVLSQGGQWQYKIRTWYFSGTRQEL